MSLPLDDEELVPDSSPDTALDDAAPAPETVEAPAAADSSPAKDDKNDDSLLGIVRDVVSKNAKKEVDPVSEAVETGKPVEKAKDEDSEYSDVPFNKHPRFLQLLRKAKTYEQDATRYQNVQTFLDNNGVSADEAAEALIVAGLAKTNPAEAWNRAKPWVQKLLIASGEVLSEDLQQMVASGEITRNAAIEVSRARAQVQSVQAGQTFAEQRAERERQTAHQNAIVDAASSWESDRHKKDPNFGGKLPLMQREIAYLHATEGRPDNPDAVRDQLERAYKAVNKLYRPPAPAAPAVAAPKAIKPVTGGTVSAGTPVPRKPASTLDIIRSRVRTA